MLPSSMTLSDIVIYALDKNYSMEQAAADLGELMNERELIKRKKDTDTHRFRELEQIIPLQETLALRKLRGDELFDRLTQLDIRVEKA